MSKKIKIMLAQLNPTVGDLEKNCKIVLKTITTPKAAVKLVKIHE